jgi:citrate lyase subunit beta/citryl-CoA lyase
MMRSLLFVPGDSPRKFERAAAGEADALILDLEDSVAPDRKVAARVSVATMLAAPRRRPALFVRVNALDTGMTIGDLAAVMPARPDGIVLPKCAEVGQLVQLGHWLDAFEASSGIEAGRTRLIAIATETAASLFTLGGYAAAGQRLFGLMWGAEDLAASLGARSNRDGATWHGPFRLARNLCLAGAAAAGVLAIDTVYLDIEDLAGLEAETRMASAPRSSSIPAMSPWSTACTRPMRLNSPGRAASSPPSRPILPRASCGWTAGWSISRICGWRSA